MCVDEIGFFPRQLVEQRAESGLRRHFRLNGHSQRVGHGKARRREPARAAGGERHAVEKVLQHFGLMLADLRSGPIRARSECSSPDGKLSICAGVIRPA